jgi:molecular chaperone DnaK
MVTEVLLTPGQAVTSFRVSGRTGTGQTIAVCPDQFAISFMLPMGAPPLPHTIAVELDSGDTRDHFDPVFKRHTPLPAEARKVYRADRPLRPSEVGATLPIKFWEIDVSDDPQEKWWAGCVHVRADKLKRPLSEGAEIDITVRIDKSRKMTVEVFIPLLNQGFADDVFVPDPPTARTQLQQQLDVCFERVNRLFLAVYSADCADVAGKLEAIQFKLEVIAEQVTEEQARGNPDPDAFVGPTETLRKIRILLTQLEDQIEGHGQMAPEVLKLRSQLSWTSHVVENHGSSFDKETLARLTEQFDQYATAKDLRGLKYVEEQALELRANILVHQRWFYDGLLTQAKQPGVHFLNQAEARKLIKQADDAAAHNDFQTLRRSINELYALQPPDVLETAREQAMRSGLKQS